MRDTCADKRKGILEMSFDTFLKIAFVVGTIVSYCVYRYTIKNVKLTYKDQRVG